MLVDVPGLKSGWPVRLVGEGRRVGSPLKLPQRREVEVTGEMGTEEWGGWWLVAGRPLGSSKPPRECREEMEEVGG